MAFIIKPVVTEKMTKITEKRPNRFGFIVKPEANKLQIKQEVESRYNVILARSRILLHPCQRSLSFTVSVLPAVETTPVR